MEKLCQLMMVLGVWVVMVSVLPTVAELNPPWAATPPLGGMCKNSSKRPDGAEQAAPVAPLARASRLDDAGHVQAQREALLVRDSQPDADAADALVRLLAGEGVDARDVPEVVEPDRPQVPVVQAGPRRQLR